MIYSCPKQSLLEVHLIFINGAPLICRISFFFFHLFVFESDLNGWLLKVSRNFIFLFQIEKSFTENVTCSVQVNIFKIHQCQFFTSLSLLSFPFPFVPVCKCQYSVLVILFLKIKWNKNCFPRCSGVGQIAQVSEVRIWIKGEFCLLMIYQPSITGYFP